MVKKIIRFLRYFLFPLCVAVLITTMLGMVFSTQKVISALNELGGEIGFSDRLSMTAYDLKYFGSLYIVFVFVAFLVAMIVALLIARKLPHLKFLLVLGAGFVAIIILLNGMKMAFFDINLVAGARDGFGYFLQGLAGLAGGWVFYRLNQKPLAHEEA